MDFHHKSPCTGLLGALSEIEIIWDEPLTTPLGNKDVICAEPLTIPLGNCSEPLMIPLGNCPLPLIHHLAI